MDTWGLRDFKSIAYAEMYLNRQLTLVAGENSSGKSSIFQSLLVLAQSVGSPGGVVLNGPLVRLGSATDVIRRGQLTCAFSYSGMVRDQESLERRAVSVETSFGASDDGRDLVPRTFTISQLEGPILLDATTERLNRNDARMLTELPRLGGASVLRLKSVDGVKSRGRTYLLMRGFDPVGIATHVSLDEMRASYSRVASDLVGGANLASPHALRAVQRELIELQVTPTRLLGTRFRKDGPSPWSLSHLRELDTEALTRVFIAVAEARYKRSEFAFVDVTTRYGYDTNFFVSPHGSAIESDVGSMLIQPLAAVAAVGEALREFAFNLSYLGPLRDEPRVLNSAWDTRPRSLPVGQRGELTAEVLTRFGSTQITFHSPQGNRQRGTLAEATGVWCDYLGIGTQVKAIDQAKLGRGIVLVVDGVDRDFTEIGVGASQLVPVVVALLALTSSDSYFFVEQPELHLHPAVQARLADFFLLAGKDKRVLVETHSEALLTRLRLRVAENSIDPRAVQILFVERTRGVSTSRALEFDEFGDLDLWPTGFFDDQANESRRIAAAVSARLQSN